MVDPGWNTSARVGAEPITQIGGVGQGGPAGGGGRADGLCRCFAVQSGSAAGGGADGCVVGVARNAARRGPARRVPGSPELNGARVRLVWIQTGSVEFRGTVVRMRGWGRSPSCRVAVSGSVTGSWAVRSLRAAVFAVLCVLLAAGGHLLATGVAPPVWAEAAGAVPVFLAGSLLGGRERSLGGIVTGTLVAQGDFTSSSTPSGRRMPRWPCTACGWLTRMP